MFDYPLSIVGYLCLGMLGAGTFLFLLLLFDKKVAILENKSVKKPWMIVLYVVLGGVLSVVVNLAGNPDFGANQLTIAFSAGLGWPAIAAGFTAGKRVGEINELKEQVGENGKEVELLSDIKVERVVDYYKKRLEAVKRNTQMVTELFDRELEKATEYYEQKLSSVGGE